MLLKSRCIMAVLLAIGVWGALAPGGGRAVRAAGTSTSTVSSGAVAATVTTTGGATVSLSTSTTPQEGQVSTCIQIMVDDLSGAFCEGPQSGLLTYQCAITSAPPSVHGTCLCQPSAPDPSPPACAGLEAGCVQFGGEVRETAGGKLCVF
jgi:hypothetical protein